MNDILAKSLGVIGAGVMGTGVAQKFAQFGYDIVLVDISEDILEASKSTINRNILLHNMRYSNKLDRIEILNKITVSTDYKSLQNVDFIIENVPEIIDLKLKVYKNLEDACKKDCIYMVNTSCIPIGSIGKITKREDRVIGVHFMNPVPLQHFAEVIKGKNTSSATILFVESILKSVEIDCTVVNDSPGFVSNRLSHLFMNEAANLVMEGVATPEQIDKIFTEGFHHKMGPLKTADLIGIDTVVNSIEVLHECYNDAKYNCSVYLKEMVEKGFLGQKSGKGFYEY